MTSQHTQNSLDSSESRKSPLFYVSHTFRIHLSYIGDVRYGADYKLHIIGEEKNLIFWITEVKKCIEDREDYIDPHED